MWRIAHLSDLHFKAADDNQPKILEGLVQTLATVRLDLLLLTGDVFDTGRPPSGALEAFLELLHQLRATQPATMTTCILPGNHDRRDEGAFLPWRGDTFRRLAAALVDEPRVQVLGTKTPFLLERVPLAGAPFDLLTYDSSYLPEGYVTAGGVVRQEELLQAATELEGPGDRPLLFLLHHHLVPTPVTDTAIVGTEGRPWWQALFVKHVLPKVVGLSNREELTMTALGAGTALSTLQTLGRAVVVLHGHKHYPTVRLLSGLGPDADLLISSAGSCGLAQDWAGGDLEETPKLWPSINLLEVDVDEVRVTAQAWSLYEPGRRNRPRVLASAVREGLRWRPRDDELVRAVQAPVLQENVARYRLSPSQRFLDRVDLEVERVVEGLPSAYMTEYWEEVGGPPKAVLQEVRNAREPKPGSQLPRVLLLPLDGSLASWQVLGGALRRVAHADDAPTMRAPFEWVGLLNRSRAGVARLEVDLGPVVTKPFASVTDLTTGKEWPAPIARDGDIVTVEVKDCPARRLLRLYWPLEC